MNKFFKMKELHEGLAFMFGLGILTGPILDAAYNQMGWVAFAYPLMIYFMFGFMMVRGK